MFSVMFYNTKGGLADGKHFASWADLYSMATSVVQGRLVLCCHGHEVKSWLVEDGLLEEEEMPFPGVWNYFLSK